MSIFKWHPLYVCKFIPERTDEQRKLDSRVMAFKEQGAKLKKERQKARVKFRCPYIDPLTNTQCSQTYATIKYPGVLKHLRLCSLRAFQGNEKRLQDYVRDKRISLESSNDELLSMTHTVRGKKKRPI